MLNNLKGKITSSITYSRIDCSLYSAKKTVTNKAKDTVNYAKEHPVKSAAKVANVATTNFTSPASILTHLGIDCIIDKVNSIDDLKIKNK